MKLFNGHIIKQIIYIFRYYTFHFFSNSAFFVKLTHHSYKQ